MTFPATSAPLVLPPPLEELVIAYLTPWMGVPVVTRMPKPGVGADTVNGLLRVESAGGTMPNYVQYDMTVLLHGYHPDEGQANTIANQAVALMSVGRGQTINGFYVVTVEGIGVPHRYTDPDVILPRYMGTATWRIAGMPWTPTP